MKPPPMRVATGVVPIVTPKYGVPAGAAPSRAAFTAATGEYHVENTDSLLKKACQKPHEARVLPLLDANRFRNAAQPGDFSRHAPRPHLPRRPYHKGVMAPGTWE